MNTVDKSVSSEKPSYSKKDFVSGSEIRWCPGCGDYSILAAVQKALPEFEHKRENYAFVSGIGCSSRFPYYMNTYGFHSIHGRALSIATGVKMANPELSVWVISGDGDALSIGGNHFIHTIRRNVELRIILFNNEIYGLTKGQYSPTSHQGTKTKSSPYGSLDAPLRPARLALGAGATFVGRTADILAKHMNDTLHKANTHAGTAFIEALQNCYIFNDGVYKPWLDKEVRDDKILLLEAGKPMIYGKNKDKGIAFNSNTMMLESVNLAESGADDILTHNPEGNIYIHAMLADMGYQDGLPLAMGVIRSVKEPVYNEMVQEQEEQVTARKGAGSIHALLRQGETWTVN